MDLRKLTYFVTVADELNFSRAARRLGVSQPVVSRAIKELEHLVEAKLFFRESNFIKLTPAGETLLPRVEEALSAMEEGMKSVRDVAALGLSVIDVGYLPSSYDAFVGDAFNVFCQTFPDTRVNPHPSDPGQMVEDLRSGKIDVALIGYICPEVHKEFDAFFLSKIPTSLVVAAHHPIARKPAMDLEELSMFPLVSLESKHFPGRHEFITQTLKEKGISPKSIRRVDSLLSVLANIANSDGFSMMPMEVESVATQHVKFLQLDTWDIGVDFHALVRRDESRKTILTLLQECRRILKSRT